MFLYRLKYLRFLIDEYSLHNSKGVTKTKKANLLLRTINKGINSDIANEENLSIVLENSFCVAVLRLEGTANVLLLLNYCIIDNEVLLCLKYNTKLMIGTKIRMDSVNICNAEFILPTKVHSLMLRSVVADEIVKKGAKHDNYTAKC